jgi:hypothetical protein
MTAATIDAITLERATNLVMLAVVQPRLSIGVIAV